MVLYIDGKKIGNNGGTTVGQDYSGYWRLGGDNLNGWPAQPTSNNFAGTIDDAAIYPTALSLSQVQKHYIDSGRTLNIPQPPTDSYGKAVYADNPDLYWRLDEASGTIAHDTSPNSSDGVYFGTIGYHTPSPVTGANGTGVTLDGTDSQISSGQSFNDPTVYSEELWFNTTTHAGGKLIGFGDQQSGLSGSYDRHIWMLDSGQLVFGVWTGQTNTIQSSAAYNDGKWHQVVATQGPDGMTLYVDGVAVGTNPQTQAQAYSGYWKVGGDVTWGGNTSNYFAGVVDEVSVYSHELTAAQVVAQYKASPAAVNAPPVASFTQNCTGFTCTFDASASHDPDGTISKYSWDFGDGATGTGVTATHTYTGTGSRTVTLTVTDDGGATTSTTSTISPQPMPTDAYGQAVVADNPTLYWRLDEAAGPNANDASFNGNAGVYTGGVTFQTPSTVTGPNGTGVMLNGSDGAIYSQNTFNNPTVFSEELWFNTTTQTGGKLIGFGDQQAGLSSNYDRHIWMLDNGQLVFGTYTGQTNEVQSSASYNDGKWHQVVAGIGPNGMVLYVDGQLVGTNPNTGSQPFTGYWRVGGDTTWGGNSSNYFAGAIDEVAVFPTVLSAADVQNQYNLGTTTNTPPTAAFASNCTDLQCGFDGSGSKDQDGTIASYSWDFGDNSPAGSGVSPSHTYTAAGTYTVTLTVKDNKGATDTVSHDVTVTAPPDQPPVAVFTSNCTGLGCSFDGSQSSDPDPGDSIASYSWDFGDNTPGSTAQKPDHTYTAAGTYTVALTVKDQEGVPNTVTHDVTVSVPANQPPVAAFASNCTDLSCSFNGIGSHDPDGSIASYAWTFGDGNTGTGVSSSDTYPAAGDYSVTLTVTDNQGATNSVTQTVSPRPPANPAATPYATDSFNRTVASGWGNADTGGAWTASNAANFSVAAGVGSIKMPTPGTGPSIYLKTLSSTDTDTTATLTTDKAGTGNGVYLEVLGRRIASGVDYQARLRVLGNNTVAASLLSDNAGTATFLKSETTLAGITYTPGMQFNTRFQVSGTNPTTLRFKAWPATSTEPTSWLLTATDNTAALQVPGSVGLLSYLAGGATNAPVTTKVSNFATAPTGAPTAAFTASCGGQACSVDGTSSTNPSGTISSWQWSWGDGTVTTGSTSSHTFVDPGTYRITLTVTNPSGWTDVTTRTVTVPA
jgi:PKD repeat protein